MSALVHTHLPMQTPGPSSVVLPSLQTLLNDIQLPNETKFHNIISSQNHPLPNAAPGPANRLLPVTLLAAYAHGYAVGAGGLPALVPSHISHPLNRATPSPPLHQHFAPHLAPHHQHHTPHPAPMGAQQPYIEVYSEGGMHGRFSHGAYPEPAYPEPGYPDRGYAEPAYAEPAYAERPTDMPPSPPSRSISPNNLRARKYQCKACFKSFTTSGHLARHSRIHTGERKHVCPFEGCNARFSRHDNCMQHFKTHLGKRRTKRATEGYSS